MANSYLLNIGITHIVKACLSGCLHDGYFKSLCQFINTIDIVRARVFVLPVVSRVSNNIYITDIVRVYLSKYLHYGYCQGLSEYLCYQFVRLCNGNYIIDIIRNCLSECSKFGSATCLQISPC